MAALLLAFDKANQVIDRRKQTAVTPQDLPSVVQANFGPVDQTMRFGQCLDDVLRKVVPLQCNCVHTAWTRRNAFDQHVRRHVIGDTCLPADEAEAADGRKMVDGNRAGQGGIVVDVDVPAHDRIVGNNDPVPDVAVMSDVNHCHQVALIADESDAVLFESAAADRDRFANYVVVSDDDFGIFAPVTEILRLAADHAARKDMIVFADSDPAPKCHVVFQLGTGSNRHIGTDHAEWANFDIGRDPGSRIDNTVGCNAAGHVS